MSTSTAHVGYPYQRSILEKEKLINTNFLTWYQNLRIVLKYEMKLYILDGPVPEEPPTTVAKNIRDVWMKHFDDSKDISNLMLTTMIPNLQKVLENLDAFEILAQLKEMFQQQTRQRRYEIVKALRSSEMVECLSINVHVLRMKRLIDQLEILGLTMPTELAKDLILSSLPKSYDQFILNYNMNHWDWSISELRLMLKTVDKDNPSESSQALRKGKKEKGKMLHKRLILLKERRTKLVRLALQGLKGSKS